YDYLTVIRLSSKKFTMTKEEAPRALEYFPSEAKFIFTDFLWNDDNLRSIISLIGLEIHFSNLATRFPKMIMLGLNVLIIFVNPTPIYSPMLCRSCNTSLFSLLASISIIFN